MLSKKVMCCNFKKTTNSFLCFFFLHFFLRWELRLQIKSQRFGFQELFSLFFKQVFHVFMIQIIECGKQYKGKNTPENKKVLLNSHFQDMLTGQIRCWLGSLALWEEIQWKSESIKTFIESGKLLCLKAQGKRQSLQRCKGKKNWNIVEILDRLHELYFIRKL